ncbi:MAG TPA: J domain-containing protein [Clostridiales bacterium UBA8960]|nr:J domain-containing protein [Clostridiales bacterium UBA8960]
MNKSELIRKLRELKKNEIAIRTEYGMRPYKPVVLVWSSFFSDREGGENRRVRYTLDVLVQMDSESRKAVFQDFIYAVYIKYYQEIGLPVTALYDPSLMSIFGLPCGASLQDVKDRFRELAHKYHPDKGGDPEVFRMFLEAYNKLKEMS